MNIDKIFVIKDQEFGKEIDHLMSTIFEVNSVLQKNRNLQDKVDSVILFHENYNYTKGDIETFDFLEKRNKSTHKIDLSGTVAATTSSFNLWLERNKPKSILIIGDKEMGKHTNLHYFISTLVGVEVH